MDGFNQLQLRLQRKCMRLKAENQDLKTTNHMLAFQNLRMRQDLQVLAMHPGSEAAQKILHRYRVKQSIIDEVKQQIN